MDSQLSHALRLVHIGIASTRTQIVVHYFFMDYLVHINLEDAQAIACNIEEHLQYDEDDNKEYWESILSRLNNSIRHCSSD